MVKFDNLMNSMQLSPIPQSGIIDNTLPLLSPMTPSHTSLTSNGVSEEHLMGKSISNSYASTVPVGSTENVASGVHQSSRSANQILLYSSSVRTVPMASGANIDQQRYEQYQHDIGQGRTRKHDG